MLLYLFTITIQIFIKYTKAITIQRCIILDEICVVNLNSKY